MRKRELFHYDSEALVFRKTNRLLKYRIIVAVLFLSVSLLSFVAEKIKKYVYNIITFYHIIVTSILYKNKRSRLLKT